MSEYTAPLADMRFVLRELADLDAVARLPGCEDATPDLVDAVLEEAGKFATGMLSPLNWTGDQAGARWTDGEVATAPGWKAAYDQFVAGGWNALSCGPEFGGQNLPRLVSAMVEEMWNGANTSFALCPMLTRGAIEAIELRGSHELQQRYLPKMVAGEWTGTMNLTEPQAGSDLAAVRTKAIPQPDGSYRVHGQKIFITYGEHDLTPNIIHLVLARTPDAPEGVKGISLFVVPKFIPKADGTPGERNDVRCASIEHKLGIHASPTAVLAFGDGPGAVGWLVGEENRGLEYMFIMMNAARFSVGLEGVGLAERAYQRALAYARDRVQGTEIGVRGGGKVAIIRHPDVRRMLMSMKSRTEAMRAVAGVVAAAMDRSRCHADADERAAAQAFVELMIPIVKGWSTECAVDIASLGVQIHGGMGFIEETGAAQHLRDARITTIYEGTTGIQAADLIGRKIAREQGRTIAGVIAQIRGVAAEAAQAGRDGEANLAAVGVALSTAVSALESAVAYIVATYGADPKSASVGAVPFLDLFGTVSGGWQLARGALAAQRRLAEGSGDAAFYRAKLVTARFYADHQLSRAAGLAQSVEGGAVGALAIEDDAF
jgi:alkylation response protein AidB-like acyl-CoA dehydrogenase